MEEMHERTSLQNIHQKKKENSKSTCESCGYNFSQNGTNAETVHQGIRNHKCGIYNRYFAFGSQLKNQKR